MPGNKPEGESKTIKKTVKKLKNSQSRRNVKSRKLINMSRKSLEVAIKCGVQINMVIFDPRTNRMEERFTTENFDLQAVNRIKNARSMIGRKNFKFKSLNVSAQMGHLLHEVSDTDNAPSPTNQDKHNNLRNQWKPKDLEVKQIFKITRHDR